MKINTLRAFDAEAPWTLAQAGNMKQSPKTVNLVATYAALRAAAFPNAPEAQHGICSANFAIDPAVCKTKFGRWLAERVPTTRRDDDFSLLRITLRSTEEDLHVRHVAEVLTRQSLRSNDDAERLYTQLAAWIEGRRKTIAMIGESCFRQRGIIYEWPALGSANINHVTAPEEYFDLCAARIRAFKPLRVALWDGTTPPESFKVCQA